MECIARNAQLLQSDDVDRVCVCTWRACCEQVTEFAAMSVIYDKRTRRKHLQKSWHDLVERSLPLERRCKDASSWSRHFIRSKFHFLRRFHFAAHKAPISGSGVTEWSRRHRRLTQSRTNTVSDLQSPPASGAVYVPPQGKYLRVSPRSPFKTAYIGVCFS